MNRIRNVVFSYRAVPFALFLLCTASYGVFIHKVGFYWDDWPAAFTARQFPAAEFWHYFADERPLSAWTYVLFAPLFGGSALAWQIFALLLRFVTVLTVWWAGCCLWPRQKRLVSAAAFLFAVYPVFLQQRQAITYHQLWIQYIAFFSSLAAMIQAIRQPRRFALWTAASILGLLVNLSISEYFYSVEMIRPLVIWFALDDEFKNRQDANKRLRSRLLRTLRVWLPYLLILGLGVGNWVYFKKFHPGFTFNYGEKIGAPNQPVLLDQILQNPRQGLLKLVLFALQDCVHILAGSWFATIDLTRIDLSRLVNLFLILISTVVTILLGFFLVRLRPPAEDGAQDLAESKWMLQAGLLGFAILVLGTLPAWTTGRQTINGIFANRFAVVSMSGASLMLVAAARWAIERWSKLVLVLSLLIWLGMGLHLRTGDEYRLSWREQNRLYWQLYWRAPAIKPHTVILMEGVQFQFMVRSSLSFALNLLYRQGGADRDLSYWAYPMYGSDYLERMPFSAEQSNFRWAYRQYPFSAQRPDSLIIYSNPDLGDCYWMLRPGDTTIPNLPVTAQAALPFTTLDRIETAPNSRPPREIFGAEPAPNWCTYYQKAELAAQMGDWSGVTRLAEEAQAAGFDLKNDALISPYESRPFIEGFAHQGDWETASRLTIAAYQHEPIFGDLLCQTWQELASSDKNSSTEKQAFLTDIRKNLNCK